MIGKLENLPEISSISGPYEGITEFELEEPLGEAPKFEDEVVFVGRFSEQIVMCMGKVTDYIVDRPDYARLKIKGMYVSFAIKQ